MWFDANLGPWRCRPRCASGVVRVVCDRRGVAAARVATSALSARHLWNIAVAVGRGGIGGTAMLTQRGEEAMLALFARIWRGTGQLRSARGAGDGETRVGGLCTLTWTLLARHKARAEGCQLVAVQVAVCHCAIGWALTAALLSVLKKNMRVHSSCHCFFCPLFSRVGTVLVRADSRLCKCLAPPAACHQPAVSTRHPPPATLHPSPSAPPLCTQVADAAADAGADAGADSAPGRWRPVVAGWRAAGGRGAWRVVLCANSWAPLDERTNARTRGGQCGFHPVLGYIVGSTPQRTAPLVSSGCPLAGRRARPATASTTRHGPPVQR